jgi:hypothetical protein
MMLGGMASLYLSPKRSWTASQIARSRCLSRLAADLDRTCPMFVSTERGD